MAKAKVLPLPVGASSNRRVGSWTSDIACCGHLSLYSVHTLVLDEYDKSLELGFQEEMRAIVGRLKNIRSLIHKHCSLASAEAAQQPVESVELVRSRAWNPPYIKNRSSRADIIEHLEFIASYKRRYLRTFRSRSQ